MAHLIIATTLPHGVRANTAAASLVLSPRLDLNGQDSSRLERFYDFLNWPNALRQATFRVLLRRTATSIAVDEPVTPARHPKTLDPAVWRTVFPPDTIVRPFESSSADQVTLQSYDARTVADAMLAASMLQSNAYRYATGQVSALEFTSASVVANAVVARLAPLEMTPLSVGADGMRLAFEQLAAYHERVDQSSVQALSSATVEPTLEFHAAVSALREHGTLTRELGLVVDLNFDAGLLRSVGPTGEVKIVASDVAFQEETQLISPWTAYEWRDVTPRLGVFHPRSRRPTVDTGGLKNLRQTVHLNQVDTDSGGLELLQTVAQVRDTRRSVGAFTALAPEPSDLPALRRCGIAAIAIASGGPQPDLAGKRLSVIQDFVDSLSRSAELSRMVTTAVGRSPVGVSEAGGPSDVVLFADDGLIRGVRVSVKEGSGPWRSLCDRQLIYEFTGGPLKGTSMPPDADRPILDEGEIGSVITSQDGGATHRVSPFLWTWDGWSLALPRPGRALSGDGTAIETDSRTASQRNLVVRASVPRGTLQRKRFGRTYTFLSRTVDLGGNSWSTTEAAELVGALGADEFTNSGVNCRLEPVNPPLILADRMLGPGEKGAVLVIRRFDRAHEGEAVRHLLPPRISVELAQEHGMLDGLSAERSYQIVSANEGDLPDEAQPDVIGKMRKSDGRIEAPYFPDPLCAGAVVWHSGSLQTIETAPFWINRDRRANDRHRYSHSQLLTLTPGRSGDGPEVLRARGGITVRVAPGRKASMLLSSKVDPVRIDETWVRCADDSLRSAASLQLVPMSSASSLVAGTLAEALKKTAEAGLDSVWTPPQEVVFVHATQRPIHKPQFGADVHVVRKLGELTSELVDKDFAVDIGSTGRLEMDCEWEDTLDIPGTPQWRSVRRTIRAFAHDLAETDSSALTPESLGSTDGIRTTTAEGAKRADETSRRQSPTAHSFEDSKHHVVTYKAAAVTRFASFMPEPIKNTRDALITTGESTPVIVLNTAPPATPLVDYVWPTVVRPTRGGDDLTRQHQGGALRVYMKRGVLGDPLQQPWFSSGNGEQIAIVLYPAGLTAAPEGLRHFVTEWGFNPRKLGDRTSARPILEDFDGMATVVPSMKLTLGSAEEEGTPGAKPPQPVTADVALAVFNVHLDAANDRLYFDVDIKPGRPYFPMIRLALTRYQQHSVVGAHVSPVVLTQFCQLAPDRSVTIKRGRRGCEIAVSGASYVDTQFNELTSTVVAHLERRRSIWGGGDVWERVPDTEVTLTPARVGSSMFRWSASIGTSAGEKFLDGFRVVIVEYETFYVDRPDRLLREGEKDTFRSKRMIFCDAVEL